VNTTQVIESARKVETVLTALEQDLPIGASEAVMLKAAIAALETVAGGVFDMQAYAAAAVSLLRKAVGDVADADLAAEIAEFLA
jgi:hypothetical protein